jgi:hypothetical protein
MLGGGSSSLGFSQHLLRIASQGSPAEIAFYKKTGKLERDAHRGGIDWFRYLHKVIVPKLYPFYYRHKDLWPNTLVQEDEARPHAHRALDI